ncbi:MAG: sigma-70 family RNA polymerase sigma factor [Rhodothermales bacterium]|nr:sigma-70 family RNA polymerase sigma factor [Rhodothermales bacterium]
MDENVEVTQLLDRAREGDSDAFDRLVQNIYEELRTIARGQRRKLGASSTVNTTAVVHEAYEKMASAADRSRHSFADRGHFFRVASRVMRDIIVDYARAQSAAKRGGRSRPVSISDLPNAQIKSHSIDIDEILSVDRALGKLSQIDREAAEVAELRYFAGLTIEQAAEALGVSEATVKRRWTIARAWLVKQFSSDAGSA